MKPATNYQNCPQREHGGPCIEQEVTFKGGRVSVICAFCGTVLDSRDSGVFARYARAQAALPEPGRIILARIHDVEASLADIPVLFAEVKALRAYIESRTAPNAPAPERDEAQQTDGAA